MKDSQAQYARGLMRYALEDLRVARDTSSDSMRPRHICGHAQQAAEKALKAALTVEHGDHPITHDLDQLRSLLPRGWRVKEAHPQLGRLTRWAITSRYPGRIRAPRKEPDVEDAKWACEKARSVVESVKVDFDRRMAVSSKPSLP